MISWHRSIPDIIYAGNRMESIGTAAVSCRRAHPSRAAAVAALMRTTMDRTRTTTLRSGDIELELVYSIARICACMFKECARWAYTKAGMRIEEIGKHGDDLNTYMYCYCLEQSNAGRKVLLTSNSSLA